ncbi:MAG: tail fiber domain-containing protein [Bacteroidales bacterium]
MKKIFLLLFLVVSLYANAQVAINTDGSLPDNSAMLDVKSTTKGMLVPRMTAAQRDAITSPSKGLLIFCTDNNLFFSNYGTPVSPNWISISSQWASNGANISYSSGNVGIGTLTPETRLDIRGNSPDDGGNIQIGNSDASHKLVLFAGRTNDPNPFIFWKTGDPLRFTTDEGGWSEKMRITSNGQLGLGTVTPDNSAIADFSSLSKGFLPPRMTTLQRNAIASPATGLLVFDTDINSLFTRTSAGWVQLGTASTWSLTGNTGTNPAINFIGTTDDNDLVLKRNNLMAGYVGTYNCSYGMNALNPLSTGSYNSAIGNNALYSNTTGYNNTANGVYSLSSNTTGFSNTANGVDALYFNTTGSENTANGVNSLLFNTTGSNNTSGGKDALANNTTGYSNTASGYKALYSNTTGAGNTANGYQSLYSNTTAFNNTANGYQTLYSNTTGIYNLANGYQSLYSNTIGNYNIASGFQSLYSNTTGNSNIANGELSLFSNTSGYKNTSIGSRTLYYNTTGYYNTASGYSSLFNNTIGIQNTAIGSYSLDYNTTGNNNTATGFWALFSNTNDLNTAVGYYASQTTSSGFRNTSIGANSLLNNTSGSYNTALGCNTGPNSANLSNTTCIGMDATATATDMVRIGNVYVNSIGGQVGWTVLSDGRFKENIKEDVPGLAFISQLRPVTYNVNREKVNDFTGVNSRKKEQAKDNTAGSSTYKTEALSETTTGFIAQEVEASAKKIGYDFNGVDAPKNEKDMYGLRYDEFVVPLVKAVQELNALNETQKITNAELKAQNEELLKRIEKLENK